MANKQTEAQPSESRIVQKLIEKPIRKIVLIDDAFDALNNFDVQSVKDYQIELFLETIFSRTIDGYTERIAEYYGFCVEHFGGKLNSAEEFDGDVILKFWEHRNEFAGLKSDLETLFATDFGKLQQVESICQQIRTECTDAGGACLVEIETHDSRVIDDIGRIGEPEVVLLDYLMGDESDADKAKENAQKIADKLYDAKREKAPLVVLMSSKPNVVEEADKFQEKTELLKGLFHCVKKSDLDNAGKLRMNILAWIERLDKGMIIHHFSNAVSKSLKSAAESVANSIRNLSLEDYAYVSDFSLKTEGQPLGEYMSWLFNAYVGRKAFEMNEETGRRQAEVDKISFSDLPVKQFMPSDDLIEMYDSALFNKSQNLFRSGNVLVKSNWTSAVINDLSGVADGRNIERLTTGAGVKMKLPFLRLGMLFVKDEHNPVLMVINADCDLTFTEDGKRLPMPVVTLISGKLSPITGSTDELKDYDTEFFKIDKKTFHVQWDVKNATYVENPQMSDFLGKTGYQCVAILKMPFVLRIQQEYAAHFSRIGLPVSPPIQHGIKVKFYRRNLFEETPVELPELPSNGAFLIKSKKDQLQCRVTIHFLNHLLDNLEESKKVYEDELQALLDESAKTAAPEGDQKPNKRQTKLEKAVKALNRKISKFDDYGSKNILHSFTKDKAVQFLNNEQTIAICRNGDKNIFAEWQNKDESLILINVISSDSSKTPAESEAGGEVKNG